MLPPPGLAPGGGLFARRVSRVQCVRFDAIEAECIAVRLDCG
jgi:hypothetical protein